MGEIKWLKCPATGTVCEHCVMEATTRSDGVERQFKKCAKANKLLRKNSECPLHHNEESKTAVEESKVSQKEKIHLDYLKERNEKLKAQVEGLEADKESLANTLQIVTEDRDQLWKASRSFEEEQFDLRKQIVDLQEEKTSLEAGQRDLFDENKGLRLNIQRLEEKLAEKVRISTAESQQLLDQRTDRFMGIIETLLHREVTLSYDGRVHPYVKDF